MSKVVISCNLIHPVGEVIFNALSTFDPNKVWPGTTWVRLKACGLFGVDEDDPKFSNPGTYVGENEHQLTQEELAEHNHYSLLVDGNQFYWGGTGTKLNLFSTNPQWNAGEDGSQIVTSVSGGNQPHNNVQKSYLGYYWLRTA